MGHLGEGEWLGSLCPGLRGCCGIKSVFAQSCCTLSISASKPVFSCGRYSKSRLVCVCLSDLDSSRHLQLLRRAVPAIQWVRMTGLPKKRKSGPHCGRRERSTQFAHVLPDHCDISTACRLCRLEPLPSHPPSYLHHIPIISPSYPHHILHHIRHQIHHQIHLQIHHHILHLAHLMFLFIN